MPFMPLPLPPGFFRNGTRYQAKGRWHDGDLVRWHEGAMRPVGNWEKEGEGVRTAENLLLQARFPEESPWADNFTGAYKAAGAHFELNSREVTVQDDPVSAPAWIEQTVGVLPAEPVTLAVVLEQHDDSPTTVAIEVRDSTADQPIAQVEYTWATEAATITDETAAVVDSTTVAVRVIGEGPNLGNLVRLIVTTTPLNDGNTGAARVYPIGLTSTSPGAVYWHHAGFEHSDEVAPIIFTTDATDTQAAGRVELDRPISGMQGWLGNDGVARVAMGTRCEVFVLIEGAKFDITPANFTCGTNRASPESGQYGSGVYGVGIYGEGDATLEVTQEAQSWQFDNFGQFLVGTAISDGKMYQWELDISAKMTQILNAPTDVEGLVVTPERFLVALGADGDGRTVKWADQQSLTTWTPTTENQAGDFPLPSTGTLMAGRRGRGETLLWTSRDLWSMQFVGGTLVYSFRQLGAECGPISRRAMTVVGGGLALWMGRRNFFVYDGHVKALPSEVGDYVFSDLNRLQSSQIHCVSVSEFNEVWWFYPSSGSQWVDRYVKVNYNEGHWDTGNLARTAGIDRGALPHPVMADRFGIVYAHESGDSKLDFLRNELSPYAESGPIEIAQGDQRTFVRQVIPDENTLGDVEITLFAAGYPTDAESSHGPFTPAAPTPVRVNGRQVRVRADQVNDGWRLGELRLEIVPGEIR